MYNDRSLSLVLCMFVGNLLSVSTSRAEKDLICFHTLVCYLSFSLSFFFFFFLSFFLSQSDLFYLIIVGLEGYCCTQSHWYTQTHTHTLGRDLYLTTHNIHKRQTSKSQRGSEPTIPASERPQTHALDRAATGTGFHLVNELKWMKFP